MSTRIRWLAAALASIGIATAITACGSAAGSAKSASASASGPAMQASTTGGSPAGDHRIGGTSQGISIEVPASFTVINLGNLTLAKESISRLGITGINAATIEQSFPALEKLHAVMAVDPGYFTNNVNAYCLDSGTGLMGGALVTDIKQVAISQLQQLGAKNVTTTDKQIGGVAGVETSYQIPSTTLSAIYGAQLEVAPKPHKECFVTLTESQPSDEILSVAAATAEFF